MDNQVLFDQAKNQYYTQTPASVGQASNPNFYMQNLNGMNFGSIRKYLNAPSSGANASSVQRPAFTPNAFTQGQLAGMGAGATPQWMMNAYTNKIQGMGGNANNPPFGVTQSGFPSTGGKTAPAQGQ
jgi:hypothetical protein